MPCLAVGWCCLAIYLVLCEQAANVAMRQIECQSWIFDAEGVNVSRVLWGLLGAKIVWLAIATLQAVNTLSSAWREAMRKSVLEIRSRPV